jgi:hypothetical protein
MTTIIYCYSLMRWCGGVCPTEAAETGGTWGVVGRALHHTAHPCCSNDGPLVQARAARNQGIKPVAMLGLLRGCPWLSPLYPVAEPDGSSPGTPQYTYVFA